jgi:hypothetical protein
LNEVAHAGTPLLLVLVVAVAILVASVAGSLVSRGTR